MPVNEARASLLDMLKDIPGARLVTEVFQSDSPKLDREADRLRQDFPDAISGLCIGFAAVWIQELVVNGDAPVFRELVAAPRWLHFFNRQQEILSLQPRVKGLAVELVRSAKELRKATSSPGADTRLREILELQKRTLELHDRVFQAKAAVIFPDGAGRHAGTRKGLWVNIAPDLVDTFVRADSKGAIGGMGAYLTSGGTRFAGSAPAHAVAFRYHSAGVLMMDANTGEISLPADITTTLGSRRITRFLQRYMDHFYGTRFTDYDIDKYDRAPVSQPVNPGTVFRASLLDAATSSSSSSTSHP